MNAQLMLNSWSNTYERPRAKGKTGKWGLIAVSNKLLKQVYAMVKN
jgi:hypothetical protein